MAAAAPDLEACRAAAERHLAAPGGDPGELFAPETVSGLVASAAADAALRPLARFAAEGLLREAGAAEVADAERLLAAPLVPGPDGPLEPRRVDAALADEPDAGRRRELQAARLRALASHLVEPLRDAAGRRDDAARGLGAGSALELVAVAAGADLAGGEEAAAVLLAGTDDAAAQALDRAARRALGLAATELDAADVPRLLSAPHLHQALPAGTAPAVVARACELLGLPDPPQAAGGAGPGMAGLAEALRAAGAGLARVGAAPRLPVEARALADPALAGAAGRLLEGLVTDPGWHARAVGAVDPDAMALAGALVVAVGARATAARAAAGGGAAPEAMGRALGVAWPAELCAADPLALLGPLDDLRARMLARALRAHLREAFGSRWFAEPRAGALLREVWLEGGLIDPADLARELGAPGLDPAALAAEAAAAPGG